MPDTTKIKALDKMPVQTTTPYDSDEFLMFLSRLEDGETLHTLNDNLCEIARNLQEHEKLFGGGAKASLSLKLSFKASKGITEVTAAIDHKLPDKPKGKTILWTDGDYFSPQNPRQLDMFSVKKV